MSACFEWIESFFLLTASYFLQVFVVLLVNKQFALKHFNGLMFMYMFIYLCSYVVLYNDENWFKLTNLN